MIKFKQGRIGTYEGESKDIEVKALSANSVTETLIGVGLILVGVLYLTNTAFKNGSKAFEEAEYKTLDDLGLLTNK